MNNFSQNSLKTINFFSQYPTEGIRITSKEMAGRIISNEEYMDINDYYSSVSYIASEIMEELCSQPALATNEKAKLVANSLHLFLVDTEEIFFCSKSGLACLKKAKVILQKLLQTMTGDHPDDLFDEAIKLADEIVHTVNEFIDCEDQIFLQIEEKQAKTA